MENSRVYNFSAGPAMMPKTVLKTINEELFNFMGSGQSVMEISHRSDVFRELMSNTRKCIKEIMNIPDDYEVLFVQGGASMQFSMIPMNLLRKHNKAAYVLNGIWSKKAYKEGARFGETLVLASSEDKKFSYIPYVSNLDDRYDYVHICFNDTIYGNRFTQIPNFINTPLIADVSSCILSEPIDVTKFSMLYASCQKNAGIAGLTLVIIKKDLIETSNDHIPSMLSYKTYSKSESLYNTPPVFAIYVLLLTLRWIKMSFSDLCDLKTVNESKAKALYDYIDSSDMFFNAINKSDRSITNIPFFTGNNNLDCEFIRSAYKNKIVNIKGHRVVGGMRASIYNAMPMSGVDYLIEFMRDFELNNKGRYL